MNDLPPMLAKVNADCPLYQRALAADLLSGPFAATPRRERAEPLPVGDYCNGLGWVFSYATGIESYKPCGCPHCLPLLEAGGFVDRGRPIKTFGSFCTNHDARAAKVLREAQRFVASYCKGKIEAGMGFALWGPTGTGKSHLLSAIYTYFRIHLPSAGEWVHADTLEDLAWRATRFERDDADAGEDAIVRWCTAPYLFLDDLGAEGRENKLRHGAFLDAVSRIVHARYDRCLPIFLSTNWLWKAKKAGEEMFALDVYGERVAERLRERCYGVGLNLPNYRELLKAAR